MGGKSDRNIYTGGFHGKLKEKMVGFPRDFPAPDGISNRHRDRVLPWLAGRSTENVPMTSAKNWVYLQKLGVFFPCHLKFV